MDKGFEDILDTCLDRIMFKGDSVEQCLESYPEHETELEPVLRAAYSFMAASDIKPRHEFQRDAKARLLAVLEAKVGDREKRRLHFWGWQRRWAVVVAVILALFMIGGSTVTASSNSLPGDVLYPVKTTTEKVRMFFAFGKESRTGLHIKLAERRLGEMELLAGKKRNVPASLLEAMHSETERAIDLLGGIEASKKELVSRVVGLTSNQKMVLMRMVKQAPPEVQAKFRQALQRSELVHRRAVIMEERIPELKRLRTIPLL